MCGRYLLTATPEEIEALFSYLDGEPFPPRYNIAPTQPIAIVRMLHGSRRFSLVRWGLVPRWVEDPGDFPLLINARAETLTEKPAFRDAARYRRCLVPASGFYEWRRRSGGAKAPFWFSPRAGHPVAFAGLWETWMDRHGSEIDSACIVTTDSNAVVGAIHDRMPAVIAPEDFSLWLDGTDQEALALLRPADNSTFEAIEIGSRVNSVRYDEPSLLEPPAQKDLFG